MANGVDDGRLAIEWFGRCLVVGVGLVVVVVLLIVVAVVSVAAVAIVVVVVAIVAVAVAMIVVVVDDVLVVILFELVSLSFGSFEVVPQMIWLLHSEAQMCHYFANAFGISPLQIQLLLHFGFVHYVLVSWTSVEQLCPTTTTTTTDSLLPWPICRFFSESFRLREFVSRPRVLC